MTWSELDWKALDRLRERFLQGRPGEGPYWETPGDVASYDFTYGERIGWKWDHLLRELRLRGWHPCNGGARPSVLDWGCGSGIAARRVIGFFGAEHFGSLTVWDQSPVASDFAAAAACDAFPGLPVNEATPGFLGGLHGPGLLIVSHVLNELGATEVDALRAIASGADAILWVEPGTHEISRRLGTMREQLRATGRRVVAPCTHENECPMFALGNERHWCHFFAPPPAEIFADSGWVKFGQRAGIDLRSVPYSCIALDRRKPPAVAPVSGPGAVIGASTESGTGVPPVSDPTCGQDAGATPAPIAGRAALVETRARDDDNERSAAPELPDLSRIIGRPAHFKPYARWLNCDATGLHELELPKRTDPALFKQLERTKAPLVYRWRREGPKVLAGEPLGR